MQKYWKVLLFAMLGFHFSNTHASTLETALEAQSDEAKSRYQYRHPKETLAFFGIEPGMTVVEALPGGGWYSKILLPLLGSEGSLIGVDYAQTMWPYFEWADADFIEKRKTWTDTWTEQTQEWDIENSASITASKFHEISPTTHGQADAFLFIRALHNLARVDSDEKFLDRALADAYNMLKPGGIVGIVQHEARQDRPDSWADGSNGYLKKEFVKTMMLTAGFEYIEDISINENPKDKANEGDHVWRLPPSLNTAEENKESMQAIGESHRMTLKFRKPFSE